jgi:hypothetical protein
MSLHYCSLHGRIFSFTQQRWLSFPQETIREIRGYYVLLCSTTTDPSFFHVLERSRDQCVATVETIVRSHTSHE